MKEREYIKRWHKKCQKTEAENLFTGDRHRNIREFFTPKGYESHYLKKFEGALFIVKRCDTNERFTLMNNLFEVPRAGKDVVYLYNYYPKLCAFRKRYDPQQKIVNIGSIVMATGNVCIQTPAKTVDNNPLRFLEVIGPSNVGHIFARNIVRAKR